MKTAVYSFFLFIFPLSLSAYVVINEVAWMGTLVSVNDEWIELYNNGSENVNLSGWRLAAIDGQPDVTFTDACVNTTIVAGGYYLLERTDDESVPGVTADCIYTGALGNTSEQLQFFSASGSVVDSVNATDGWPAGDNTAKETMQRSGGSWITATPTPKKANSSTNSVNPPQNTSETNSPNTNSTSSQSSSSAGGDEPYVQPEDLPHIKIEAGEDQRSAVGEQVQFRPHAWGLDGVLLENARYMWNFGDGVTFEGQNVSHTYMFPGTYMVRAVVSSGKYSASDDLHVIVEENSVSLSEVMPGDTGWVEFQNRGSKSIHVGGWIIETSGGRFIIPLGTTIAPQSFTVLSATATHLFLKREGDNINLFYPNGTHASSLIYVFMVPQGSSVSDNAGISVFTEPTPGKPNKIENTTTPQTIQEVVTSSPVLKGSGKPSTVSVPPQKTLVAAEELPVDKKIEEPVKKDIPVEQASIVNAPVFSKTHREVFWFGGSLILGGLAAAGVALFRRRKSSMSDTAL